MEDTTFEGELNTAQATSSQILSSSENIGNSFEELIPKFKTCRLNAEDALWSRSPIPHLVELCRKAVVSNFEVIGPERILQLLNPMDRDEVMKSLPTNLPLEVTLPLIEDNLYWERRCQERWRLCDVFYYEQNWRTMFVERHVEELIEKFSSEQSNYSELEEAIKVCRNLIFCLSIKQLQVLNVEENKSDDFEKLGHDFSWKHTDVGLILKNFPNLKKFSICYAPNKCGLEVDWDVFKFTNEDCVQLCSNLEKLPQMQVFHLYKSQVTDIQCEMLASKFLYHSSLTNLDLSYNSISDRGCSAIAKLLISPCPLEILVLCHNGIGEAGITSLAAALTQNTRLKTLDISLNRICDNGGLILFKSLERNSSLQSLYAAGNRFSEETGFAMCKVIETSKSVIHIDISANCLGKEVGTRLAKSLNYNTMLMTLDVRFCQLEEEDEILIRKLIAKNSFELSRFHLTSK